MCRPLVGHAAAHQVSRPDREVVVVQLLEQLRDGAGWVLEVGVTHGDAVGGYTIDRKSVV